MTWDTVIEEKTNELAGYLNGRTTGLHFVDPVSMLEGTDSRAVREAIVRLTQSEARKLGIGKSSLHYLKNRAHERSPLSIYSKTRKRLSTRSLSQSASIGR